MTVPLYANIRSLSPEEVERLARLEKMVRPLEHGGFLITNEQAEDLALLIRWSRGKADRLERGK